MSVLDVVMQDQHLAFLRERLMDGTGIERAAYLLFGVSQIKSDPFVGAPRTRLLLRDVLPVEADEVKSADSLHVSWSTARFVKLLACTEKAGLHVGIAHSHPAGPNSFSAQDDRNEKDLWTLARNRNGDDSIMPSVLVTGMNEILARAWVDPGRAIDATRIRTVGPKWRIIANQDGRRASDAFNRQALALGPAFTETMKALRIGVVGAGGTGSPLIQQLARMGLGHLAIFDPDTIELTNLNRVYGATIRDVDAKLTKAALAKREVERTGLGTKVEIFESWIGAPACQDALKSMDLIFGCTDDHDGRSLLNRLAYYYLIPVIDLGLALRVRATQDGDILDAMGRVTVLEPGASCLLCRNTISPALAAEEALKRTNPDEYDRRKAEAYVRGEGNPAPAVVCFTTSVATMAIEEMIQRLQQFRGVDRGLANRMRSFTRTEDFRPGAAKRPCRICGTHETAGRGDVTPFLGRVG